MGDVTPCVSVDKSTSECSPLSQEARRLAYDVPDPSDIPKNDVQVFDSGEHTVTEGKVLARGNAVIHAMTDEVTVIAVDHAQVDAHKSATVHAFDSAHVLADGDANVFAHDQSTVDLHAGAVGRVYDHATASLFDHASVVDVHHLGRSDAKINLFDSNKSEDVILFDDGAAHWVHQGKVEVRGQGTTVYADGNTELSAYSQGTGVLSGSATGTAWDTSSLMATGNSTAYGFQYSTVRSFDNAMVHAHEHPQVFALGHSVVAANDESTIYAYENSTVHARDSLGRQGGSISAYDNTTVIRDRYDAGPPHTPVRLYDQSVYEDTDDKGNVISVKQASP